ncbi:hypothetical protein V1478_017358 [Vespula squamosa]|uniref:Uncharacterized protein n=1 Tax=Vespula squamosa TaxID=30214 RepID=A0ABD2A0C6_VESSQ
MPEEIDSRASESNSDRHSSKKDEIKRERETGEKFSMFTPFINNQLQKKALILMQAYFDVKIH